MSDPGLISHDDLLRVLRYVPETGEFFWVRGIKGTAAGSQAGSRYSNGYVKIRINGRRYAAHRLAWFIVIGKWPVHQIDHINRNRSDNRFCNLREATASENRANAPGKRNNPSGAKGVEIIAHNKFRPFRAVIVVRGRRRYLGYFTSLSDAADAYNTAAREAFGEFALI